MVLTDLGHDGQQLGSVSARVGDILGIWYSPSVHGELNTDDPERFRRTGRVSFGGEMCMQSAGRLTSGCRPKCELVADSSEGKGLSSRQVFRQSEHRRCPAVWLAAQEREETFATQEAARQRRPTRRGITARVTSEIMW